MILYRWRNTTIVLSTLLLALLLLVGCGGTQQVQAKPTPTPSPTPGPGQQLLDKTAHAFNTAQTLHGVFNLTIDGQNFSGSINTETWNETPAKNRTVVLQSTVSQLATTGSITVSDGKQLWQYDPQKKVVYTGPVTTSGDGTPGAGSTRGIESGQSRSLLNLVQSVFTRSDATLKSSSDTVNGHAVYDVHVVPQSSASSGTGAGSFNYTGEVYIDKATQLPVQVNLDLQGLGKTVLNIPMLVLNQVIPESTFTFVPPAGVKVLPLQQASVTAGTGSISFAQAQQQAGYHLLSIPDNKSSYMLQGVNALGSPGSQIYTLNYTQGTINFTIAEGKPLANLPDSSGQRVSVRGATGVLSSANGATTLSWTENGVGIRITGNLSNEQVESIAKLLS